MTDISRARIPAGLLRMSAAALMVWVLSEGWAPVAKTPIPGDVPTHGFGTTAHADGQPVKLGEKIEPVQAVRRVIQAAGENETQFNRCIGGVALLPQEFDAFVLLGKNVGMGSVCKSSIPAKLKAGQFDAACKTILDFAGITRVINGQRVRLSCEVRANGCYGVYRDKAILYKMCSTGEYAQ